MYKSEDAGSEAHFCNSSDRQICESEVDLVRRLSRNSPPIRSTSSELSVLHDRYRAAFSSVNGVFKDWSTKTRGGPSRNGVASFAMRYQEAELCHVGNI